MSRRALVLDVDGVLVPFGSPTTIWGDLACPAGRDGPVVSRELTDALAATGAERIWNTTWHHGANDVITPLVGWPDLAVLDAVPDGAPGWWKLGEVAALLATGAHERVVWVDDDLDRHAAEVDAAIGDDLASGRVLCISPRPHVGLDRTEVARLTRFLGA